MSLIQATLAEEAAHLAVVFAGQGSQKVGMLAELYERFLCVKYTFQEASDALAIDLWQLTQDSEKINQTEYTQPILLTASVAIWRAWLEGGGLLPKYLAGHSLGEYSALVAAESLTLLDAVKLVQLRGQLMQQAVPAGEGAMAAILGWTDEQVVALCQSIDGVDAANFNAKGQVVIAGTSAAVRQAIDAAKQGGAKAINLPVSVPSHCHLMKSAADQLAKALEQIDWQLPKIPVIHNINAQPAQQISELKQALIHQLYQPVQWTQTLDFFQTQQIEYIVECGAGNVLTNLAKRLDFVKKALPTDTVARFEEALHTVLTAEGKIA